MKASTAKKCAALTASAITALATIQTPTVSASPNRVETSYVDSANIPAEKAEFFNKVVNIGEFFFSDNGYLNVSLSDSELKERYGFTDQELTTLHNQVLGADLEKSEQEIAATVKYLKEERVYKKGNGICIPHHELVGGIAAGVATAAAIGPEALMAALLSLGTITGGPVGLFISGVLAGLAAPSMVEIAGRTVSAVATKRGVYIGSRLDYPPIYADYC